MKKFRPFDFGKKFVRCIEEKNFEKFGSMLSQEEFLVPGSSCPRRVNSFLCSDSISLSELSSRKQDLVTNDDWLSSC